MMYKKIFFGSVFLFSGAILAIYGFSFYLDKYVSEPAHYLIENPYSKEIKIYPILCRPRTDICISRPPFFIEANSSVDKTFEVEGYGSFVIFALKQGKKLKGLIKVEHFDKNVNQAILQTVIDSNLVTKYKQGLTSFRKRKTIKYSILAIIFFCFIYSLRRYVKLR